MKIPVSITVNGRLHERDVEPRLLLVHFLRDVAGAHWHEDRLRHEPVRIAARCSSTASPSSRAPAWRPRPTATTVTTIEGLAPTPGTLHPLQEAFWNKHGLQCGFCTPGMIFAVHELLRTNPHPTPDDIRHGLEGNLCRCTGYQNIVRAVQEAAAVMGGAR